jgi:hypothetical protein
MSFPAVIRGYGLWTVSLPSAGAIVVAEKGVRIKKKLAGKKKCSHASNV